MTKSELHDALVTTIANHKGAHISETSTGLLVSVPGGNGYRSGSATLVAIRNELMQALRDRDLDRTAVRYTKKPGVSGHWNMGRFVTDYVWREFLLAA